MGFIGAIAPAIQAVTSILAGNARANAATQGADFQVAGANHGLDTINGFVGQQQNNQNPFIQGGQQSLGTVMQLLQSGYFGKGSSGDAPKFDDTPFTAPTADEARNTPGYQFTATQGSNAIQRGAAAAGGTVSGGSLKALAKFNSGLADSTYNDVFNRALTTHNSALSDYQARLQGYGAQLQGRQQEFNQAFAPVGIGETAAQSMNNTLTQQGENIASEYNNIGNAQASGIINSTNQRWNGIQTGITQALGPLAQQGGGGGFGGGGGGFSGANVSAGLSGSYGSSIGYQPPPLNLQQYATPPPAVSAPYVGPGPSSWGAQPVPNNNQYWNGVP